MQCLLVSRPTQLPSVSEHEGIVPSPAPSVPLDHSPVSRPVSRRSTASAPVSQTETVELWVASTVTSPPIQLTTNRDSFDVYIDEVRFIPDKATIIKVTENKCSS